MTWKPLNEDPAGAQAVTVKDSLRVALSKLGAPKVDIITRLNVDWAEIVGPEISEQARPLSLVGSTLTVVAQDPRWVTQLRWMGTQISKKVNDAFEEQIVSKVEVKLDRPSSS